MSITGWKKRKKLARFMAVYSLVGIPFLLVFIFLGSRCHDLARELKAYEDQESGISKQTGFVLKCSKNAGQPIDEKDLVEVELVGGKEEKIVSVAAEDLIGKCCKISLPAGSFLTEEVLTEWEEYKGDMRKQTFRQIVYTNDIKAGDRIDIRIAFPTGEDYIVIRKKEVIQIATGTEGEDLSEEGSLTFYLGEEELLRLSSAFIDVDTYPGTEVYAVSYVDNFQEPALITYPMNQKVYDLALWDPNITEPLQEESILSVNEVKLRTVLEKNLQSLFQDGEVLSETEFNKTELSTEKEETYDETVEFFP